MNTAAASVMRDSAAEPPILNRIRNTSAFFRKLSLNVEKNWYQNRGAKRLDSIRGGGMPPYYCKILVRASAVAAINNWAASWLPEGSLPIAQITDSRRHGYRGRGREIAG